MATITVMNERQTKEADSLPIPDPARPADHLCGVPKNYITLIGRFPRGNVQIMWKYMLACMHEYHKKAEHALAVQSGTNDDELLAIFAEIDIEGLTRQEAHRKKIRAAAEFIDPIIFMRSLQRRLMADDPYAGKLYADIMGLGKEAIATAKEMPIPEMSFNYTEVPDEPESAPIPTPAPKLRMR